ncbi:DNA-binding MarR family transcriptional regulator [Tamaricihabitans halophyticus]|uniref:DNA-binding MarR family transcriptional regulator n=1 Tax=Tamaricihabitans halophyticus TaxID=1262583 RepID=A0A4V2SSY8_9PSEU|nr:DNA-binding MarR family transcriptional regulator [Tamaricihabitans halophyticus]
MATVSPSVARAASRLRGTIGQLHRRLRQVDHAGVLTPSQTAVLSELYRNGPASQAQLAQVQQVRQQSMASNVTALEQLGHLQRTADPHDGRRSLISLTEHGRQTMSGLRRTRDEWLAAALANQFTPAERQTLVTALPLLERLAAVRATEAAATAAPQAAAGASPAEPADPPAASPLPR